MHRSAERAQFLADIIVTAIEGGIGYWSRTSGYAWYYPDLAGGTAAPGPGASATATATITDDEDGTQHTLDPDRVATALATIEAGPVTGMADSTRHAVRHANRHNSCAPETGLDIDADLADQIVQIALLGQVIYG